MGPLKILLIGMKVRRGWKRIPPERRRRLVQGVGKQARTRGPVLARRVGAVVKGARKAR